MENPTSFMGRRWLLNQYACSINIVLLRFLEPREYNILAGDQTKKQSTCMPLAKPRFAFLVFNFFCPIERARLPSSKWSDIYLCDQIETRTLGVQPCVAPYSTRTASLTVYIPSQKHGWLTCEAGTRKTLI